MSDRATLLVCCCICHRYRAPDKMNGVRCIDVKACHAAALRAAPVKPPKSESVSPSASESRFSTSVENEAWKRIADACEIVLTGRAERIDGAGWKVYRAGTIIRIDLSPDFNPTKPIPA